REQPILVTLARATHQFPVGLYLGVQPPGAARRHRDVPRCQRAGHARRLALATASGCISPMRCGDCHAWWCFPLTSPGNIPARSLTCAADESTFYETKGR